MPDESTPAADGEAPQERRPTTASEPTVLSPQGRTEPTPDAATGPRYEMRGELGAGGVGTVANAFDRVIGREVAYKTPHDDAGGLRARFLREARVTGQLEHPGIVPVYDMGTDAEGRAFYTMRRVQGRSLGDLLDDLRGGADEPGLQARIDIFLRACDAVAYAHESGVIHRDLKPENIMAGRFGQVLVVDWGLAARVGEAETRETVEALAGQALDRTLDGTVMGTPAYMPPEQAKGALADIDERSDIYSLGAVLYETLTLERPFTGDTLGAVLGAVIAGALVPPRERAPAREIPARLEAVVLRAMARDPAERHATVLELQADVRRAIVAGRVADEIDLRRIDPSVIYSGVIGLHRTHLWLSRAYLELVRPWKLTPPQVNLVRIIHGSRDEGISFAELYEREIWTDFDTRGSVQGLVDAGLVRTEGEGDATRFYATTAGQEAADAIIALDHHIEAWVGSSDLSDDEWRTLSDLLARIRAGDLRRHGTWEPGAPGG